MPNLFELLPQHDKDLMYKYICNYSDIGGASNKPAVSLEYLMRYWNNEKQNLYKMLGDNFIISKRVSYTRSAEAVDNDYCAYIGNYNAPGREFCDKLKYKFSFTRKNGDLTQDDFFELADIFSCEMMFSNIYSGNTITLTHGDDTFVCNKGAKLSRMLGKLAKFYGIDEAIYEKFRVAHSMFLNQKNIQGDLCLSIHPLDYMTMSDNDCGWESCMNWMSGGEYREGTVEMMNSPYVVVAYLRSDKDMNLFYRDNEDERWNNKRWRELFIIHKDMIIRIKPYPYECEDLDSICLKWLKELAEHNLGWGPYTDHLNKIHNHSDNQIGELNRIIRVDLDTDYMYNDLYNEHDAYISLNLEKNNISFNFSGVSECMNCGEPFGEEMFDDKDNNACQLICYNCSGLARCCACSEFISTDSAYWVDGKCYCEYCHDEHVGTCPGCEEEHDYDDMDLIRVEVGDRITGFGCSFCESCLNKKDVMTKYISTGKTYEQNDLWNTIKYVKARDLTEDGKEVFGIDDEDIERLENDQKDSSKIAHLIF